MVRQSGKAKEKAKVEVVMLLFGCIVEGKRHADAVVLIFGYHLGKSARRFVNVDVVCGVLIEDCNAVSQCWK
jgi:hypothetical protein